MADNNYDERRPREVPDRAKDKGSDGPEPDHAQGGLSVDLREIDHWIFDLDGTLTIAVHDFDAIRAALGIPEGRPILEHLASLPVEEAAPLRIRLDEIEKRLARGARPEPGAEGLLRALARRDANLGILTRNSHDNAVVTLDACGLAGFFEDASIVAREHATPKPDPEGVRCHLDRWRADPDRTVLVGDFLFDLQAGRAAGTRTVYFDPGGTGRWSDHADVTVSDLRELL